VLVLLRIFLIASSLSMASVTALAQAAFPERQVRIVVPYPPGGAADILGRVLAERLASAWGQPVIVDNKVGAGGTIGVDAVAKSPPDGHTLVLGVTGALTIAPSLRRLPYDPLRDLAPISLVGEAPSLLAVHPSVPAGNVTELIALAKARPGKLSFSSAGIGTSVHIAAELFKSMADVDILHVPYKGGTPSVQALLGGEVSMTFETVPSLAPHVKAGSLKGLAVTSLRGSSVAPGLPPVAQTLPGYQVTTWFGLFAPAGTPAGVVQKIHDDVAQLLAQPPVRERLTELGIEPVGSSAAELAQYMASETQRFATVIKKAGITGE
jgi:tripartite-type tricarboxylate transporter receptor subunit TctC